MRADGEEARCVGVVINRAVASTRTGKPYVRAGLVTDDGERFKVNWWDASAPPEGARVAVRGQWSSRYSSISATSTRLIHAFTEGDSLEHRLLAYYQACVEREVASGQELHLTGRGVFLVQSGAAPLDGRSARIDTTDSRAERWIADRKSAAGAESVFAGYPIVRQGDRSAALFTAEVLLAFEPTGVMATPLSKGIDVNPTALRFLGVDDDDIDEIIRSVEDQSDWQRGGDRLAEALDHLRSMGVLPAEAAALDPAQLDLDPGASLWNAAALYVGETSNAVYRRLLQDLTALRLEPVDRLQAGPLGVLFGRVPHEAALGRAPLPTPLPSTPQQDAALASASHRELTVVTGPPGTGKTQVLANAVACALARGESVLIASRNLQAIDVVYERIRSIDLAAAPVRIGKRETRSSAASAMAEALARPPAESAALMQERRRWAWQAEVLEGPYRQLEEREHAEQRLAELDKEIVSRSADLPEGCTDGVLLQECVDDMTNLLLAAQRVAAEIDARPAGRWFWQRRARKRLEAELTIAVQRAMGAAPGSSTGALTQLLVTSGERAVIEQLGKMVELAAVHADRTHASVHLDKLPAEAALVAMIEQSFEQRRSVAAALFAATWSDRFSSANGAARRKAASYQQGLSTVASSGSGIEALRSSMASAMACFPVWTITSLSVGTYVPLDGGLFDVAIIDEASQSDVASALPVLFRAKRAVIVGDPDQLTHITRLTSATDDVLALEFALSDQERAAYGYEHTSLFRLAASRSVSPPVFLDRHYRSDPEIIGFSNEAIYGGRLDVRTVSDEPGPRPPTQWIDVRGGYEHPDSGSARNRPQADAVVELLERSWRAWQRYGLTVGVVTPFRKQRDLIVDLLGRSTADLLHVVRVGTADSFQGDERDVMVLSTVVDGSASDRLRGFAASRNRINVSVTRARRQLIVVGDLDAALSVDDTLGRLAHYIQSRSDRRERDEHVAQHPLLARWLTEADRWGCDKAMELAPRIERSDCRPDVRIGADVAVYVDGAAEPTRDLDAKSQLAEEGVMVIRFGHPDDWAQTFETFADQLGVG